MDADVSSVQAEPVIWRHLLHLGYLLGAARGSDAVMAAVAASMAAAAWEALEQVCSREMGLGAATVVSAYDEQLAGDVGELADVDADERLTAAYRERLTAAWRGRAATDQVADVVADLEGAVVDAGLVTLAFLADLAFRLGRVAALGDVFARANGMLRAELTLSVEAAGRDVAERLVALTGVARDPDPWGLLATVCPAAVGVARLVAEVGDADEERVREHRERLDSA
jgi:hypothetical protein